jgi:hypothetical protein
MGHDVGNDCGVRSLGAIATARKPSMLGSLEIYIKHNISVHRNRQKSQPFYVLFCDICAPHASCNVASGSSIQKYPRYILPP